MLKKNLGYLITIGFTLFIGFIIYSANSGRNLEIFKVIGKIPMGDKIGHLVLVGILTYLMNASLKNRVANLIKFRVLVGSVLVCCAITIEEFSQIWIESRNFDLLDLTFNYLGIIIASRLNNRYNK